MHIKNTGYTSKGARLIETDKNWSQCKLVLSTFVLLASFGVSLTTSTTTMAQTSPVTVDLSVLDNNFAISNTGAVPARNGNFSSGGLLMPSSALPVSKYYGPALSNEVLNSIVAIKPATTVSTLTTSDTVSAPDPVAMPEAPSVAVIEAIAPVEDTTTSVALEPQEPVSPVSIEPPALPEAVSESAPSAPATPEVAEPTTQTASLTPASASLKPGRAMQLIYTSSDGDIPAAGEASLKAVAAAIKANDNYRIQLMAFAGDNGLSSSKSRRLSLSRALSVRSFFIGQGVRSTRIDVRALGDKTDEAPLNRVDINITER